MESQLLGFFQDRMATAYEEQTWAVALVSGMNAFIASNAELIRKGFKRWVLVSGITTISLLATAFVWSRHCIFVHYDIRGALSILCSIEHIGNYSNIKLYRIRYRRSLMYLRRLSPMILT
jgi:hypothetical protein